MGCDDPIPVALGREPWLATVQGGPGMRADAAALASAACSTGLRAETPQGAPRRFLAVMPGRAIGSPVERLVRNGESARCVVQLATQLRPP